MMALPHSQQQQQQLQQQQQRLSPAELSTPNLTTMFPSSNCRVSPRCPNEAELGFRVLSPTRTRVAFAPVRYGARPQARGASLLTHSDTPPPRLRAPSYRLPKTFLRRCVVRPAKNRGSIITSPLIGGVSEWVRREGPLAWGRAPYLTGAKATRVLVGDKTLKPSSASLGQRGLTRPGFRLSHKLL